MKEEVDPAHGAFSQTPAAKTELNSPRMTFKPTSAPPPLALHIVKWVEPPLVSLVWT